MYTLFNRPNILFSSVIKYKALFTKLANLGCKVNYLRIITAYTVIYEKDEFKSYRMLGRLHRDHGPAVTSKFQSVWYHFGRLHRNGGPAKTCIMDNAIFAEEWYVEGKLHRIDGPAIIFHDWSTPNQYWINGKRCWELECYKLDVEIAHANDSEYDKLTEM